MTATLPLSGLPMADVLEKGLQDLRDGRDLTQSALLVQIAAPRLLAAGMTELATFTRSRTPAAEHLLFDRIRAHSCSRTAAFAQFKSLLDELASLESAATLRAHRTYSVVPVPHPDHEVADP